MKLVSFISQGQESFGAVVDDHVIDLRDANCGPQCLRAALPDLIKQDIGSHNRQPLIPLSDVALLPPIVRGQKIVCVGLNYRKHAEEANIPVPKYPSIFVRFPDSVSGHGQPVIKATASDEFDFEGELAVIIGSYARNVKAADAMGHVAGFSCFADNAFRDFQRHGPQATPGKNFPASGGFGPWIVTADEVGDLASLVLTTRLNGTVVQESTLGDMIFPVAELIEYVSSWTELAPGDVIATGTPAGVGAARNPPLWMKPGDVLEVEIPEIGLLRQVVSSENARR